MNSSNKQPPSAKEIFGDRVGRYNELDIFSEEDFYRPIFELASPRPGEKVLDLATGTGLLAIMLARRAGSVTGCDVTPEMLELAGERAGKAGQDNVKFIEAEATELPFQDGTVDLVTCRTAFHHFPEPEKALAEIHRIMAPGGRLVIEDVVGSYERGQDREVRERLEKLFDPSHILVYTQGELARLLEKTGFRIEKDARFQTERLDLEIVIRLEKITDPETRAEILSILESNTGKDLGGLDVLERDGGIALRWHTLLIKAKKASA